MLVQVLNLFLMVGLATRLSLIEAFLPLLVLVRQLLKEILSSVRISLISMVAMVTR